MEELSCLLHIHVVNVENANGSVAEKGMPDLGTSRSYLLFAEDVALLPFLSHNLHNALEWKTDKLKSCS